MKAAVGLLFVAAAIGAGGARSAARIDERLPTWSPNAKWIAYVRITFGRKEASSGVFLVRPDGSGLHRVRVGRDSASWPTWSPRGTLLAFERRRARTGKLYVQVATAGGRPIRTLGRGQQPAWSPNGRRLAILTNTGLTTIGADGSDPRQVALGASIGYGFPDDPAWSPDGSSLAVALGSRWTAVVPASGGTARVLGVGQSPAWSPDGSRIAVACIHGAGIKIFDPASESNPDCDLGLESGSTGRPQWSRDGKSVLYGACAFTRCRIFLRRIGASPRVLAFGSDPFWSPDGRRIVFARQARAEGRFVAYVMNADGTNQHRLVR
jgi:Tol biopolymer transport system component